MSIDIIEQMQIIHYCEEIELYQAVALFGLAMSAFALVIILCPKVLSLLDEVYHKWLRLDGFGKIFTVFAIVMLTLYGGAKHGSPKHADADDGLGFVGIEYEVTNMVVSASVTNTYTDIRVLFTGTAITVNTPVQVRMTQTNEWTTLTKINPTAYYDGVTNNVHFGANGDMTVYPYWYVGSNPPGIIIEVTGITLEQFVASSHSVMISWTCDEPKATEFVVEYRNGSTGEWIEVMTTTDTTVIISGFFVNRTTQWRVSSTYSEDN